MSRQFPSEQQERFIIRLPDGMRRRIAEAAKANGRSMNSEIVSVLEQHFPVPMDDAPATMGTMKALRAQRDRAQEELQRLDAQFEAVVMAVTQHLIDTGALPK